MSQTAQIDIRIDAKQAQETFTNLRKGIRDATTTLDGLIKKYGENSKQADAQRKVISGLQMEYDKLSKSVTDVSARFDELNGDLQPVSTRLGEVEDRLYELSLAGDRTSQEFRDLMVEAGRLRQTMILTDLSVDAMAMTMTQKLMGATQGVLGVFTAFQGVTALVGSENEELQKTMVKVQGAMALLQGIDAFKQSLPSLRALGSGLLGLIPSFAGATTASGALAVAMNALPFVAIVTGIGLLVAGIATYISSSNKAAKEEEKRNKLREKEQQLIGPALEKQNEEIGGFRVMIGMLQKTNAGSKERSSLISEINTKYGTTLKNLKDEKMFQDQLNSSVINFIALQKARFKVETGGERLKVLFSEEERLKEQINLQKEAIKKEKDRQMTTDDYMGSFEKKNKMMQGQLDGLQKAYDKNQSSQEALSKQTLDAYNSEKEALNKLGIKEDGGSPKGSGGGNYGDALDKQNTLLDKRRQLLEDIQRVMDREKNATKQLEDLNLRREEIESEGTGKVFTIRNKYEQDVAKLKLDYSRFEESLIEGAIEREIKLLDERFVNGKMTEQQYRDEVIKIRNNGKDNLLQIEKELLAEKESVMNEEIDKLDEVEEKKVTTAINSRQLLEVEIGKMTRDFQKEQEIREVQNSKKTEEEKNDEILKIKKEYYDGDKYLLEQIEQEKLDIINQKEKEELDNMDLSFEQRYEIQKKYEKERLQLSQDTQKEIGKLEDDGMVKFQKGMEEKVGDWAGKVAEFITTYGDMFMDLFGGINDLLDQLNQNRIDSITSQNEVMLENIQRQYDSRAISEEEYNALVLQQQFKTDEQIKSLKRKQFQREKSYNIANAIMQGALAVLNGLSTKPLVPLGIIMAGVAGAMTGVQIATISQQQFQAARGGIVPSNGLPGDVDSVPSKLAPGEAVINSRSTSMFPNVLSLINQAGGGIPLVPESVQQGSSGSGTIFVENQPQQIRAYVVETEITDTQRRVGRIQRSVEF